MISPARLDHLVGEHRELRKQAFLTAAPGAERAFREAEASLRSCKTAAEAANFHRPLLRHLVEP